MSLAHTNLDTPAPTASTESPTVSGTSTLRLFLMLIRREFWEHRSLWMAPLVIAILLVASAIPARFGLVHLDPGDFSEGLGGQVAVFALTQWALTVPLYIVMVIVLSFYLLDCLYAERKDRSILFWKSLPVSDAVTVTSKLIVALVVVPLGVYVLALVANLLFSGFWIGSVSLGHRPNVLTLWDTVAWVKVEALMLFGLILSVLWYAPLAAYLLLISAWARRNVFLWATLPPVVAMLVERLAFHTHFVASLLAYRMTSMGGESIRMKQAIDNATVSSGHHELISLTKLFDAIDARMLFGDIDLWLGLAVAAGLAFGAARIRRYRDDT